MSFGITSQDTMCEQSSTWVGTANRMGNSSPSRRDEFDALITLDQRIPYQQNLTNSDVGVIVLIAITDNVDVLRTLVPQILETLHDIKRGEVVRIHPQR